MLRNQVPFYFDYWPDKPPKRSSDFFPFQIRDGQMQSEDFLFCSLCTDNGIPVYLNTNIVCNHMGTAIYKGE
jgi:hypothetical protein